MHGTHKKFNVERFCSLGRKVLLNEIESIPTGKKYWEEGNVSSSYVLKF